MAVLVLAITAAVLGWGISFALKPHGPEHYGLGVDGTKLEPGDTASPESAPVTAKNIGVSRVGLSVREAMKTPAFWLMVIAFAFSNTALAAVVVHQIPFLEDMGISKLLAATALGTMTLMSTPGRLFGGWLADRWDVKYLYAVSSIIQAVGLFIFSRITSMSWVWAFVIVYGLSYGIRIPLESVMRAKYFGPKAFGTIYGYMNLFAVFGSFGGPYFAGWIFDTTSSYLSAFFTFAVMMVIASIIVLFIKSPLERQQAKVPAKI
jgi:MFS family permease